jgi:hypothetical protein
MSLPWSGAWAVGSTCGKGGRGCESDRMSVKRVAGEGVSFLSSACDCEGYVLTLAASS